MSTREGNQSGRYAYEGLDRTLHERARLSIMTSLMSNPDGLYFNDLKALCDLSDGNLSRHLSVLEDADLVISEKVSPPDSGHDRTKYDVSETGKTKYLRYLDELEKLVEDAHTSTEEVNGSEGETPGTSPSFSPSA